ncbi:phasin family protein [Roseovarius arcticus]|uniref:phasin family protein n=1 Tax=Roseovarius arcticus TaxID=2547404 RepID=UPI0014868237|nr:phasin family protein [Roseovarius arcticus]
MTKVSKKPDPETVAPLTAGLESMAALNPMRETAMKVWFDMGAEAMQFMSSRMEADVEIQEEMLSCKRLEDVQKVQAKFFSNALEDYNAEAARMMKIMSTAMTQEPEGAMPSTKQGHDYVSL